jgi:hypothetical protein
MQSSYPPCVGQSPTLHRAEIAATCPGFVSDERQLLGGVATGPHYAPDAPRLPAIDIAFGYRQWLIPLAVARKSLFGEDSVANQ